MRTQLTNNGKEACSLLPPSSLSFFSSRLERDIRLSYFVVRIAKLLVTMMWCTHVAGCIFYYLATTLPPEESLDTWMGSLVLGSNVYVNFRDLDLGVRYVTSLYWAFITIATIGYGLSSLI